MIKQQRSVISRKQFDIILLQKKQIYINYNVKMKNHHPFNQKLISLSLYSQTKQIIQLLQQTHQKQFISKFGQQIKPHQNRIINTHNLSLSKKESYFTIGSDQNIKIKQQNQSKEINCSPFQNLPPIKLKNLKQQKLYINKTKTKKKAIKFSKQTINTKIDGIKISKKIQLKELSPYRLTVHQINSNVKFNKLTPNGQRSLNHKKSVGIEKKQENELKIEKFKTLDIGEEGWGSNSIFQDNFSIQDLLKRKRK